MPLVQVHNVQRSIHGNVGFVYSIFYQAAEIRYVIMYLIDEAGQHINQFADAGGPDASSFIIKTFLFVKFC